MNLLLHLLPLLSFAAAGAPLNHKLFKLRVSTDGPYGIAGKYVSTTGTSLGLYTNKPDFQGYIDAADPGILHSAVDPGKKVYLRPTHGTPAYYVLVGDPLSDPTPPLTLWSNWTVAQFKGADGKGRFWLDYAGDGDSTRKSWVACPGNGGWELYFGAKGSRCEGPFEVEVLYAVA